MTRDGEGDGPRVGIERQDNNDIILEGYHATKISSIQLQLAVESFRLTIKLCMTTNNNNDVDDKCIIK